jgi:hypothetical protein
LKTFNTNSIDDLLKIKDDDILKGLSSTDDLVKGKEDIY